MEGLQLLHSLMYTMSHNASVRDKHVCRKRTENE